MSSPLLVTKLFIPLPGKRQVYRTHLVERLDECLDPGCRLALVSAPAGFGKTTLLSAWAAHLRQAQAPAPEIAWLSLDDGDNDPVTFWSYVIAAIQTRQEALGKQALSLLQTVQPLNLESALALLVNELARIPGPFLLVLDDYHLIRSPVIHQSLAHFIERLPPQFHLVLGSRTDPPLPLALLRGRGQLLEIRLKDLRFSVDDAQAFLNEGMGLNLPPGLVQALHGKTEGWIVGLQMAALSLREGAPLNEVNTLQRQEQVEGFVASFSGSSRYILDYLIEQVLAQQSADVQQFLVKTSILERLCGPLCDAVLADDAGQGDGQTVLEYLESVNLFILPLDDRRYWYRYHHLFADLLRKRLRETGPAGLPALHRRAADWYEQNGMIANAVEHAFQAGDTAKAAALVSQVAEGLWGRGEHETLLRWMAALPEAEKRRYPHLWVWQVSMLITAGKIQEAERCIPDIEAYIHSSLAAGTDQPLLMGRLYSLRTYIASFYGDLPALFENAALALEHMKQEQDAAGRCGVSLVLSNAHLVTSDLLAAERALRESIEDGKKSGRPHMVAIGLANLSLVLLLRGELNQAERVCQEGLQMVEAYRLDQSPMAANLWISWGSLLCERGALAEAETAIRQGSDLARERGYLWQQAWGGQALARLLFARGRLEDVEAVVAEVEELARAHEIPAHDVCAVSAWKARAWIVMGRLDRAALLLQNRGVQAGGELSFPRQLEHLALARLNLVRGEWEQAAGLIDRLLTWAEARQQTGERIQALILRALLCQARGERSLSQEALGRAMQLARPEGALQVFLEEGEALTALVSEAARHSPEFAGRLLLAFHDARGEGVSPADHAPSPTAVTAGSTTREERLPDPAVPPLSQREIEVLRMIVEGHSNKEIAQTLYLSVRTVKYYATSIYTKLNVTGRTQAAFRARELGLL